MRSRNAMLSVLLVCGLLVWAVLQSRPYRPKEGLNRNPVPLRFSAQALCQLRCMGMNAADAAMVLANGLILYHRSNRRATPCPVWAVQGKTSSGATCRLRLEQCRAGTVVVGADQPGKPRLCTCNEAPPGKKISGQLN